MKPLKDEIRDSLAERFGIKSSELIPLGGGREDSDGIVYTVTVNEKRQVLKISQAEDEKLVKSVLEFAHYLGSCGIHVSNPIRNTRGNIYEVAQDENTMYIATLMDFIEGRVPDANDLIHNEKLVYEWGKLTGKMHKMAKEYPVWKNANEEDPRYGFEAEIDSLSKMAPNEEIREKWEQMREKLRALPISRDSYGFIHNDNHQMNIIASGEEIAVIDFDCAECHFFANDILLPIQGLLFDVTGGMMNLISKPEVLKKFYESFLAGYRTENEIDSFWLEQLGVFLEYRRLLLYTVLQGWLSQDEQANAAFLQMIHNPCDLNVITI
ncbi:MAG: phosphotransferase [Lachnospiraceae bacterium]|nr:phosphotransferase [Lachnospiraceae bacterium]